MTRVAVIGANGQVGAELCLLLAARPDIDLVPVCRNRSGSAFLRWQGIRCRHGRVGDPLDAPRLLADCDIIVNSSLASGTPAQIRRVEDAIVRNMFAHSNAGAAIIHFSTQSVYGDARDRRWIRWRNPYGRVKLATERRVRSESRRRRKPAYILRLGHVCGMLQEISNSIRTEIRAASVLLPSRDCSSNTVYTAAIAGAIDQIIRKAARAGTYDLMNTPRWSWREVYEYEARVCGMPFAPKLAAAAHRPGMGSAALEALIRFAASLAAARPIRDAAAKSFAHFPDSMNAGALAWWYARRARTEIAALSDDSRPADHLTWVANGVNFFPADMPTIALLQAAQAAMPCGSDSPARPPWPGDLPDA
jgi:nucleoside-diphosphate-sugar epimerase